jgi:hypothetical protein
MKIDTKNCSYDGEWVQGKFEGQGTWLDSDKGVRYAGAFENGLYHGKGVLESRTGRYEGHLRVGKMHGEGKLISFKDGAYHFEGAWEDGKKHGWFRVIDWLGRVTRRRYETDSLRESHVVAADDAQTAVPMKSLFTSFISDLAESAVSAGLPERPGNDVELPGRQLSASVGLEDGSSPENVAPTSHTPPPRLETRSLSESALQKSRRSGVSRSSAVQDEDRIQDATFLEADLPLLSGIHAGDLTYSGSVDRSGLFNGHGKAKWAKHGCSYNGEWKAGVPHGRGVFIERCQPGANLVVHEGGFVGGIPHGSGRKVDELGRVSLGTFQGGVPDGWVLVDTSTARGAGKSEPDREWQRFVRGRVHERRETEPELPDSLLEEGESAADALDVGEEGKMGELVTTLLDEIARLRGEALDFGNLVVEKASSEHQRLQHKAQSMSDLHARSMRFDESSMDIGKTLGTGSFGRVFSITHRLTGGSFAAKVFFSKEAFDVEVAIFEKLQSASTGWHKNVVKMIAKGLLPDGPILVMPLFDCSMWTFVADRRDKFIADQVSWFTQRQLADFCTHILRGLSFLHDRDIAHRE